MTSIFARDFAASELLMLQQVGFGLAGAIILDGTVIRSVLVPASMALLGDITSGSLPAARPIAAPPTAARGGQRRWCR